MRWPKFEAWGDTRAPFLIAAVLGCMGWNVAYAVPIIHASGWHRLGDCGSSWLIGQLAGPAIAYALMRKRVKRDRQREIAQLTSIQDQMNASYREIQASSERFHACRDRAVEAIHERERELGLPESHWL